MTWKTYAVIGAGVILGLYAYSKLAPKLGLTAGTPASK